MNTELIAELIRLDPATGKIYWKERQPHHFTASGQRSAQTSCRQFNTLYAGKEALTAVNTKGYRQGTFMRKNLLAHRVVFLLAYGYMPEQVDHINGDRRDNRPSNLREATGGQNNANSKSREGSSSKYLGVHWSACARKWAAQIGSNGKHRHLGLFETEEEAALAYNDAAAATHGEFARLNVLDVLEGSGTLQEAVGGRRRPR